MSATVSGTIAPPTLEDKPLDANDRCDRCGAQAYVRASQPAGAELLFCGHHSRENVGILAAAGWIIYDETGKLTG